MSAVVSQGSKLRMVALVGSPNSGKSALFNALTGARQKVANYAGVTVERKVGALRTPSGHTIRIMDLPGIYGMNARSEDEAVTRDVLTGARKGEALPDLMVIVADATRMENSVRLALDLKQTGIPAIMVINKHDVAEKRGHAIDTVKLELELGMPVIRTAAVKKQGLDRLMKEIDWVLKPDGAIVAGACAPACATCSTEGCLADLKLMQQTRQKAKSVLQTADHTPPQASAMTARVDAVLLHRVWGPIILFGLMFLMFQSVFTWATVPMDMIDQGFAALTDAIKSAVPQSLLRDLITDGVIAGVGGVLVFLPQILALFFFILILEDSGYMARAAFLLDRSMGLAGLHGRSFIPLLSSFACAVPGIMASRVIENRKDRLLVIMVAPLITCSARLPVYTLIVAALIPEQRLFGVLSLQGVVFFALYLAGIASALIVARVLRKTALAGKPGSIIMEMPNYQMPHPRDIAIGLYNRAKIFIRRAGTIILSLSIVVWVFSNFPQPPEGFTGSAVEYSLAGRIGHLLQPIFAPLGFDWAITASLVPTMAAREVFVASLSTIYAVSDADGTLAETLRNAWTIPVAFSVLAWFVYAPQCIAMLAAIRRETGSRNWTGFSVVYLFALAWLAAFVTYRVALAFGL